MADEINIIIKLSKNIERKNEKKKDILIFYEIYFE